VSATHLARNLRQLRQSRGASQAQLAKLAGIPRATWANLESGEANPTLAVLGAVAGALGVSLQELLSPPRRDARVHPRASLPERHPGSASVRRLLPDPVPGTEIERVELPPGGRFAGVPHTPGTWEYLAVEAGCIEVTVAGERLCAGAGDVIAFAGDQRHAYHNPGTVPAVGYSVVVLGGPRGS